MAMLAMCVARFALSFCTCQRSQFYLPPVMENDTCRPVEMAGQSWPTVVTPEQMESRLGRDETSAGSETTEIIRALIEFVAFGIELLAVVVIVAAIV